MPVVHTLGAEVSDDESRQDLRDLFKLRNMKPTVLNLAIVLVMGSGCLGGTPPRTTSEPVAEGSAFDSQNYADSTAGFNHPLSKGEEWLAFVAYFRNESSTPVTLRSARLINGEGLGTVVKVTGIEIGPVRIPGGFYNTYPPVFDFGRRCQVLEPQPVSGYVLDPGEEARLLVRLLAVGSGRFRAPAHEITYMQGETYVETLPVAIEADVSDRGRSIRVTADERTCLPPGGKILS